MNSDMTFTIFESYTEKQGINNIISLYNRHEDEPDFDCEFLSSVIFETQEKEV